MEKAAPAKKKFAKTPIVGRSKVYHFSILGGAMGILIIGGVWRGGRDQSTLQNTEMAVIEALRKEVSGVQSALKRNELQAIQETMTELTRRIAPFVVGLQPQARGEVLREIAVYGSGQHLTNGSRPPTPAPGISGLLIDQQGHVLTSAGVARYRGPLEIVSVTSRHTADLVSVDYQSYLALVKLRVEPDIPAPPDFRNLPEFRSGEWLVRVGRSPGGAESRSLTLLESVHMTATGEPIGLVADGGSQMDGSILIDVSGEIAGVFVRPSDSGGFIVPIRRALDVISDLQAKPQAGPIGWVGLELQELTDDLKEHFSAKGGALISSVAPESPAAKAGLRPMDLIETVAGEMVTSPGELMGMIGQTTPGTELTFGIMRDSGERTVKATVSQPLETDQSRSVSDEDALLLKVATVPVASDGAVISSLEPLSIAHRLGIQAGDVIQYVNRNRVRGEAHFWTLQRNVAPGKSQLWGIQRGERFFFVAVKMKVTPS
jgi:S1-C subfamily serine protease